MKFYTRVACFYGCPGSQKKKNIFIKGEIHCILHIFLEVFMLYARAPIGRTDDGLVQYSSVFSNTLQINKATHAQLCRCGFCSTQQYLPTHQHIKILR